MLLIHGTGVNLRFWHPVVGRLAAHVTVIAVDLPGFGLTPPLRSGVPPTPAGFARVLADFLRELGCDGAHVVGNSVGGWTALEMAKRGAARSVVALSSAGLWRWEADTASAEDLVTYINSVWNGASERAFVGEDRNLKRGWRCGSLLEAMGIMLLLDMTGGNTIKKCQSRGCPNYFRMGPQSKSRYCSKRCANRASTRLGRGQAP